MLGRLEKVVVLVLGQVLAREPAPGLILPPAMKSGRQARDWQSRRVMRFHTMPRP